MGVVAVHSAIREQSDQMQPGASCFFHCPQQSLILGQGALLNRQTDPGVVLVDDPAATYIEVPYLGVSHLAPRQPHGQARGGESGCRVVLPESL